MHRAYCRFDRCVCLIPADFTIEAHGTLQPKISKNVYAPMDGVVEEVRVEHGQDVLLGTKLLNLRDPKLELEVSQISGELATSSVKLASVRPAAAAAPALTRTPVLAIEIVNWQPKNSNLRNRSKDWKRNDVYWTSCRANFMSEVHVPESC